MAESKLHFKAALFREREPRILRFISIAFTILIANRLCKIQSKQYVAPFHFHATISKINVTMKCFFVWNISYGKFIIQCSHYQHINPLFVYFKLMRNFGVFMIFNELKTFEVQFMLYCVFYTRMFMNSIYRPILPQFTNRVVWNRLIN